MGFATAGTIVTIVTCTNRTTHTNVSLRTDHKIKAIAPANAQASTERKSFSMTDRASAKTEIIANMPEKIIISMYPA